MNTTPRIAKGRVWTVAALFFSALFASCGEDQLSGRVVLSGSSTMSSFVQTGLNQWLKLHPLAEARMEAIGSDAGLERLLRYGDADFALSSRELTDADNQVALAQGKSLISIPVAWDAVCLVVGRSNTWSRSMTSDQTKRAFTMAKNWSDLDGSWPSTPIHRFVLGSHSGTTDVFAQRLLDGNKTALFAAVQVQISENVEVLARGISTMNGSIGFLGWTSELAARPDLRVLALDGILPSPETVRDRTYSLRRQLWLVSTKQSLAAQPAVRSFLRFLSENNEELVRTAGLIPLSPAERAVAQRLERELAIN